MAFIHQSMMKKMALALGEHTCKSPDYYYVPFNVILNRLLTLGEFSELCLIESFL